MRLNRKIEKRDLGMEGGDETLRARARRWRDVRTGVYMLVLQNFSRFFLHLSNFAVSLWCKNYFTVLVSYVTKTLMKKHVFLRAFFCVFNFLVIFVLSYKIWRFKFDKLIIK